jgi:hypothetical protein
VGHRAFKIEALSRHQRNRFIVNHDGRVYQKDLGLETDQIARAMKRFDPDSSWQAVPP